MTHDVFGPLKYRPAAGAWVAFAPFPRLAAVGTRPALAPPTEAEARDMIADMNQALDNLRELMREKHGAAADEAFAALDGEAERDDAGDEMPDPHDAVRERKRRRKAGRRAARLARGEFPVRVADPDGSGPRPEQAAAFRHLTEHEEAVLAAVRREVWESFRDAYDQEEWRQIAGVKPADSPAALAGRFALTRVEITREHRGGLAHLVFTVDSDWQDEHGLFVVYSPDAREAMWAAFDGVAGLTPSDDPTADPGDADAPPTPHDELVEAVLNGDEAKALRLVAAGADINALASDEYPPLCMAVDQLEVDEVRRLLAFGADPTLADPEEEKTPLQMAKRMYKEMGFGPAKKKDALLEAMMTMAREAAGKQFEEMKARLDAIIALLETAGGAG